MHVCKGKSKEKVAFSFTINGGDFSAAVRFTGHKMHYNVFKR